MISILWLVQDAKENNFVQVLICIHGTLIFECSTKLALTVKKVCVAYHIFLILSDTRKIHQLMFWILLPTFSLKKVVEDLEKLVKQLFIVQLKTCWRNFLQITYHMRQANLSLVLLFSLSSFHTTHSKKHRIVQKVV